MRRLLALSTTIALTVTGLGAATAVATPNAPAAPAAAPAPAAAAAPSAAFLEAAKSKVTWKTCASPAYQARKLQCGSLKVPLDYRKPNGKKITLALSRRKHTSSAANYQGIMLVNPGGPGGSGLGLSILADYVPGTSATTYDWIGFDPRGVGASKPALACKTGFDVAYDRPNYVPSTARLEKIWRTKSARYAAACANTKTKRALIKHVHTIDTVRDMDSIRKALGMSKLNYYGFSYGTYLGQVYATKYPKRVRRMVWDGTVNPTRVWYAANLDQDRAFEVSIKKFFAWLAKNNATFKLGTNPTALYAGYYQQLAKLDAKPGLGKIGPDELTDVLTSAAYYVFGWNEIGEAYTKLVKSNDASGILALYPEPDSTKGSDNGYAMYVATQCSEGRWPRKWSTWRTDNWRTFAKAPFLTWSNAWFNAPCATWKVKPQAPVKVKNKIKVKILMIGETYDAATPFSGSLKVRSIFKTASLIEGVGGTTHAGSLNGVACTDNAIARYLATGATPKRLAGRGSDLKCAPVPQPDPAAADARVAAPTQNPVRAILEAAQRH